MSLLLQGHLSNGVTQGILPPVTVWNGIPHDADGSLAVEVGGIDHYHQGLPFTINSRLAVVFTAPATIEPGCYPRTGNGRMCCGNGALIDHYNAGVPYAINGRVVFETVLGPELLSNNYFDSDVGWFLGDGWSIAGGLAICDGSQLANSAISQGGITTDTVEYQIEFAVEDYVAGQITPVLGNGIGTPRNANGVYIEAITALVGPSVALRGNVNFIGNVSYLSCRQIF